MDEIKNFNEWLMLDSYTISESQVQGYYDQSIGDTGIKQTAPEQMNLAKNSNLQKMQIGEWSIKPSLNSAAKSVSLAPNVTRQQWADMHENMVDALGKIDDIPQDVSSELVFFSKTYNQGYVVSHDPVSKELTILDVLPNGKQFSDPVNRNIMMESPIKVFSLVMNEDKSCIVESCVMNEQEILAYATLQGDNLGFVTSLEDVTRVIAAQPDNPEGIAQYVRISVPFKQSPDGVEYTGCVNFDIYRPGQS